MKTSKFTEEQIAFALKQAETGDASERSYPKDGYIPSLRWGRPTEQTFYRWKKKYGGMMTSLRWVRPCRAMFAN